MVINVLKAKLWEISVTISWALHWFDCISFICEEKISSVWTNRKIGKFEEKPFKNLKYRFRLLILIQNRNRECGLIVDEKKKFCILFFSCNSRKYKNDWNCSNIFWLNVRIYKITRSIWKTLIYLRHLIESSTWLRSIT